MAIQTSDYEKLGKFYLGRTYDLKAKALQDELVMYDSKDLVTHGLVLGMTGSGKTGLCLALLEEAAMDSIPAIVIDPKGDIPNIMLQFPELLGSDFRPWINEDDATKKGLTPDEFAEKQAASWKAGLAEWGEDGERIRALSRKVDVNIFTPGSKAGIPVSILSSLDVPDAAIVEDSELFSERIETTVSSLLALMGITADPIQSPEHILLSNIFSHCWQAGESLTLQSLIAYIQQPPFTSVGVVNVDDFFDPKKRQALAMKMNNLLASPGFSAWLRGVPLDINKMLHAPDGRARISIFSIAHLNDTERMFFVSLLLNQMLGWMRTQTGTNSLRALLYMDEIYGYLPPTANPPSKKPMMTMLKQARAFGLGILLATQNPVDLDYKALSNMGTWFLGRLQTERDKARVIDGLEGAAASQHAKFDRRKMEETLAGLGERVFLLNNVHEDAPIVFHVRWVMSYLRGPLARDQIKVLMDQPGKREAWPITEHSTESIAANRPAASAAAAGAGGAQKPPVNSRVEEFYMPVSPEDLDKDIVYMPAVLRAAEIKFADAKLDIFGSKPVMLLNRVDESTTTVNPAEGMTLPEGLDVSHLKNPPHHAKEYGGLPAGATDSKYYSDLETEFEDWLYQNEKLQVWKATAFGMYSKPGETEGDFRARLNHHTRECRDKAIGEVRQKFDKLIADVESARGKAQNKVDVQAAQANSAKVSAAVRIGSSIFGALFGGRKKFTASKASTAASGASRAWKEDREAAQAKDLVEELDLKLKNLEKELEDQIADLTVRFNPETTELEPFEIRPLKKNVVVKSCGLAWLPYVRSGSMGLDKAWA